MPSGFEDYLSFEDTSAKTALSRAYSHRSWLLAQIASPDLSKDGMSIRNQAQPMQQTLSIVDADIRRLRAAANGAFKPSFVPTVRTDPSGNFRGNAG
jgi:hypothetical protein